MEKEPWLSGQIDMLLLSIISRGPVHGYALIEQLKVRSRGAFDLPEGTVYPALYRLEGLGFLKSEAEKAAGRTRRTYRITRAGSRALSEREESWRRLVRSIDVVLKGGATAGHG
jgi:DNA-binding PadR family transcriptional regulator